VVDEEQVRAWWRQWPSANIGVVAGAVSDLLVLDVDADHGGWESLELLERRYGFLRAGPVVGTGGGGVHIYFAHPGVDIGPSAGKLGPGLDIRADRGLVVAPPSLHRSGNRYVWQREGAETPATPRWLVRALLPAPKKKATGQAVTFDASGTTAYVAKALANAVDAIAGAGAHQHNHVINAVAYGLGRLVGAGLVGEAVVTELLEDASTGLCDNRHDWRSGYNKGLATPARVAS